MRRCLKNQKIKEYDAPFTHKANLKVRCVGRSTQLHDSDEFFHYFIMYLRCALYYCNCCQHREGRAEIRKSGGHDFDVARHRVVPGVDFCGRRFYFSIAQARDVGNIREECLMDIRDRYRVRGDYHPRDHASILLTFTTEFD